MNVGLLDYRPDLLARHGFRPPVTYTEMVEQIRAIRSREGDARLDGKRARRPSEATPHHR